jgi:hypothetical protein
MLQFKKARKLAEAWVEIITDGRSAVDRDRVRALPYGWLFPWNSKEYLADRSNVEAGLIGNVPIFVDRVNAEIYAAGPAGIDWLAQYETSIPKARLEMTPEPPDWSDE